ncbi:MAG: peptidoglycan synthetase, partial [Saprospiraceae bacterium]
EQKVYQDFAHAPSKVIATMQAVRENFSASKILCFLELHTYSSLNREFLPQYEDSLNECDLAVVFYDKRALEIKKMEVLPEEFIKESFGRNDILVFDNSEELKNFYVKNNSTFDLILFLGSGNWGGLNVRNQPILG